MNDERNTSDRSGPMAGSDTRGDSIRSGLGTMTRPGPRPRPRQDPAPEAGADAIRPRPGRPAGPVPLPRPVEGQQVTPARRPDADPRVSGRRTAPVPAGPRPAGRGSRDSAPWRVETRPRVTGPVPPPARPARETAPRPQESAAREPHAVPSGRHAPVPRLAGSSHRMPFVLLLCALLGGALVCALVISTTLAEGSFRITKLQESTSALVKERQALEQQVAQAQSPPVIAQRASRLGMRDAGLIQFLNLKTGTTRSDAAKGWLAHAHYPGYTP